jgi:hypothetical protein
MNKILIFGLLETIDTRKKKLKEKEKLIDIGCPLIKCAYQMFIIQNLDVLTLKLGMKVQFTNF